MSSQKHNPLNDSGNQISRGERSNRHSLEQLRPAPQLKWDQQVADLLIKAHSGPVQELCHQDFSGFKDSDLDMGTERAPVASADPYEGITLSGSGGRVPNLLVGTDPGFSPETKVVLSTARTAGELFNEVHKLLKAKVTDYDLSDPSRTKGGLTSYFLKKDVLKYLRNPGMRLFTMEKNGLVLACWGLFVDGKHFPPTGIECVKDMFDRRVEQNNMFEKGPIAYLPFISLDKRAFPLAKQEILRRSENWQTPLQPEDVTCSGAFFQLILDSVMYEAKNCGIETILARIRHYPNGNVWSASNICSSVRGFLSTSAVSKVQPIVDAQGTKLMAEATLGIYRGVVSSAYPSLALDYGMEMPFESTKRIRLPKTLTA